MTHAIGPTPLNELHQTGVLSRFDLRLALGLARLADESNATVLQAVALTSRQVAHGHACLDLDHLDPALVGEGEALRPSDWSSALARSPLVGGPEDHTPLVLDGHRLYLRRYFEYERRLAQKLAARARRRDETIQQDRLVRSLDRYFPLDTADAVHSAPQRQAARMVAGGYLGLILGGPGTGKTATVARVLAVLAEQIHDRDPRFLLLAPTGKAAARLAQSMRREKAHLPGDASVAAAIPEEATTVHRRLGNRARTRAFARATAAPGWSADAVVLDEASMVDLALMTRLMEALPDSCRLVLLGDPDQLASVEVGAVLKDLYTGLTGTPPDAPRGTSPAATGPARAPSSPRQLSLTLDPAPPKPPPTRDGVVVLRHNYRYGNDSGIGRLAAAIREGDSGSALALLDDPNVADVDRYAFPDREALADRLGREAHAHYRAYMTANTPHDAIVAFDRYRILCAHRRGRAGVETVNRWVGQRLFDSGPGRPLGADAGKPVLITQNDYALQLYNGDTGLLLPDEYGTARAWFSTGDTLRAVAPSRLPPHELAWAISIHKSQGSEFETVSVVLPETPSRILSRELLYTAITRARKRVSIYASADILRYAMSRRVHRATGLGRLLAT